MLRSLALLAMTLLSWNAGQSQSTDDEIRMRATVQAVAPLSSSFSGKIIPVATDPRFALTMRIESAVPAVANFTEGLTALNWETVQMSLGGEKTDILRAVTSSHMLQSAA